MRNRSIEKIAIAAVVVGLTIAHYLTPVQYPVLHDLYRRLYYVPIIWAAFRYGLSGGLITSLAVSVLFIPHVFHRWGAIVLQTTDAIFEIILYNAIAVVTGILASAERIQRDRLERANIALLRSDQMKLLGEIAAGMAHEIRNPLASLRGGIDILGKDGTAIEERNEVAGILIPEVERIEKTIKEFLSYARPAEPSMTPLDIGGIVSEVFTLLEKSAHDGVELKLTVSPDVPKIKADASQMRSVILNLALNAVSAVGGNGKVELNVASDGNYAVITVKDNGKGIDAADANRIFEPFFTTREKGLGLGLSIVKRIVDEHGGTIRFESEPGKGTIFTVRFTGIKE